MSKRPLAGEKDLDAVCTVLRSYFNGLHEGDADKIRSVFHEDSFLQTPGSRRSREDYLNIVSDRLSPKAAGEPYRFKILWIELIKDQAMAKLDVPVLGKHHVDYLGLLKEDGRWRIVNKMSTTL